MQIRSITDVITNSSSEVFIIKLDDPDYEEIKKLLVEDHYYVQEFKTLDDVKTRLDENKGWYSGWEDMILNRVQGSHGQELPIPEKDPMINVSKENWDSTWEKVKDNYSDVLGISIVKEYNDCRDTSLLGKLGWYLYCRETIIPVAKTLIPEQTYTAKTRHFNSTVRFVWKGEDNPIIMCENGNTFNDIEYLSFLGSIKLDTIENLNNKD